VWRVTLRSLWEHKRRLVSTVLAIVLGVAFMSGTFVFADTIDKVFADLFGETRSGVDVQVQGVELFDGGFGGQDARELLDIGLVDEVSAVEGVEVAEPFIQTVGFGSQNRVLGPDGEPLGASAGPPTLIESWVESERLNPYRIATGEPPSSDDEIALNVAAAEDAGFELGDEVRVVSQLGEATYRLVATFTFGEAESAAGAVSADFTLAEAQRLAGLEGRTQVVLAAGDGSVDEEVLTQRVASVLPPTAEAITGTEAAEQDASDIQEGFGFFRQLLSIFAGIALLVGTFIIANTFAILVAQRTRELALLRAIGAGRRQVLTSVLLEALVIGLVAAVLGLLGGIALATAVTAGLEASGADLPTSGLVISTTTVVTALVLGLGITLLASVVPAIQATRVPPLAALRDVAVDRSGASKPRIAAGVLLLALGGWSLSSAWRVDEPDVATVGLGALALIVGAIVIGPVLAEPSVRILGAALPRLRGITGVLATENAARILLHDQYVLFAQDDADDREGFLSDTVRVVFDRLTDGELPGPRAIATELGPAVDGRHLQLWSRHADEQALFERIGADGSATRPAGVDSFGITTQNLNGNKIDWFTHRDIDYGVDWDPETGTVEGTLTATIRNDAPTTGLPPSVIGWGGDESLGQTPVADGENLVWVTAYVSHPIEEVAVDGEPIGDLRFDELGHQTVRIYISVPSQSERTVQIRTRGVVEPSSRYVLRPLRQPMANPDDVSVHVHLPDGWAAAEPDARSARDAARNAVTWEDALAQPRLVLDVDRASETRAGVDRLRHGG